MPALLGNGAAMTEAELQRQVIACARDTGWRVAHFRAGMDSHGRWRTPVQADGAGFPDLVLVKPGRCIVIELKSDIGNTTTEQMEWLGAFESAGISAYILRPAQWASGDIAKLLLG